MSEDDAATTIDRLAAEYDDWCQIPLSALGDALEQEAVSTLIGEMA